MKNFQDETIARRKILVKPLSRCFCIWNCSCFCVYSFISSDALKFCNSISLAHAKSAGFVGDENLNSIYFDWNFIWKTLLFIFLFMLALGKFFLMNLNFINYVWK